MNSSTCGRWMSRSLWGWRLASTVISILLSTLFVTRPISALIHACASSRCIRADVVYRQKERSGISFLNFCRRLVNLAQMTYNRSVPRDCHQTLAGYSERPMLLGTPELDYLSTSEAQMVALNGRCSEGRRAHRCASRSYVPIDLWCTFALWRIVATRLTMTALYTSAVEMRAN